MIYLLFSLTVVYPEDNEEIEDFFIVLTEYQDTILPGIYLDTYPVSGEFRKGDYTLVFFPSTSLHSGYHTLMIVSGDETTRVNFVMKGVERRDFFSLSAGVFYRYSSVLSPSFSLYMSLSGYKALYGFLLAPQFSWSRDTSGFYIPFYLYAGRSPIMLCAGLFYPLGNSPFMRGRQIYGIGLGSGEKTGFFWGKIPFYKGREVFGFSLGSSPLRFIGVRTQSLDTIEPFDDWVAGLESKFNILKHRVIVAAGISVFTRDMNREVDDGLPHIPGWLFHLNTTTIPLKFTNESSFFCLELRSSKRNIKFRINGSSFYNMACPDVVQNLWMVRYTERINVDKFLLYTQLGLTSTRGNLHFLGKVGLTGMGNRLWYSFISSSFTHIFNYYFSTPFVTPQGYLLLSDLYRRFELNLVSNFPFRPGLKLDFSLNQIPMYSICSQFIIYGVSLYPELLYSDGLGFRIRVSGKAYETPWNLGIFYTAKNSSVHFQTSHRFTF